MPISTEVIRTLTLRGKTEGIDQATAAMKGLAAATDAVTKTAIAGVAVTDTQAKRQLSLADAVDKAERRFNSALRSQQDFEKIQRQMNAAVAQNPALQERASAVIAQAAAHYGQAGVAAKAFSAATSGVSGQLIALSAGAGPVGTFLSALGPWGIAAAVGLGAAEKSLSVMSTAAHELADKAKEIREFSEATGLTATQFQALRSEAGKFGIDSATLSSGLSKFSAGFNELRQGSGQLLTDIRKINPALADQMQATTDAATAFTLFGQAVAQTDNIFQRNALLKAGLGKGSAIFGGLFESAPDVAALGAAAAVAGRGLDDNLIKNLAQLQVDIDRTTAAAKTKFSSIFAEDTLRQEKQYADTLLSIATYFSDISKAQAPSWLSAAIRFAQTGSLDPATQARTSLRQGLNAGASGGEIAESFYDVVPRPNVLGNALPPPEAVKTVEALVAGYKNYIAILGSAATPTERLAAAIAELEIKAKEAGNDGLAGLARGIAGLKLDDAIARQSAHNAALGQSASVLDLVKAKTLELEKARQQDAGLTEQQIANARTLTAEQALGVTAMKQQADASRIQAATLGMSAGAAAEYTAVQTRLADALRNKQALTAEDIAQIKAQAAALGQATQASAVAAANDNVRFGARTSLLSPEDVQIAQQLKGIYPDVATALNSVQASGLRTNQALSGLSSQISGQLVTGLSDIFDGTKSVSQGFGDMSKVIARAIEEMVVKLYIVIPLMRALQSLVSGFGGGGGSSEANAVASGIAPLARGQAFGSNVIPFAQGSVFANRVFDSPTLFKFASGGGVGSGVMGEAGAEAVVPLRRGADGKLGIQSAGGASNVAVNVNVQHDSSQSKVSVQQSKNNSGGVDLQIMVEQIEGQIAGNVSDGRGSLHSAMTSKFGLTPKFA